VSGPVSPIEPIDYVERWRGLVRAREEQGRRLDRLHGRGDHWGGERAARFRRMTSQVTAPDPFFELLRPHLTPRTTVLDVGAGTGRHVVRIAPLVASVTAIEPSPAMRGQLEDVTREAGLTNVTIVPTGWPEAEVAPADVVICSHVAYFVEDIEPFVRRLREVARERAYVVHRHRQREQAVLELFEQIWGESRRLEPSFADLFGVATQLGLYGNVASIPFSTLVGFESLDDAVAMVRADVLNPEGDDADRKVRDYVAERMVQREGQWTFGGSPTFAGVLWWSE
jgi:SAM-dependent methyltransferase